MHRRTFVTAASAFLTAPSLIKASKANHTIQMITEDGRKLFAPDLLHVNVGEVVRFVNDNGNHNTQSLDGMIPADATPWKSKIGETFDLVLTHEGVYGFYCTPHLNHGMVGVIVAGKPDGNLAMAQAGTAELPPRAKELLDILLGLVK